MASKQKTVGIRVPEHPICRLLLETLGNPIVNTRVHFENEGVDLADPYEIEQHLGNRIELVIDGGSIFPDPSSVIDLTGDCPEVLRVGKGDVNPFR
jgi:tRNA A37 threonylcarbamoyladenosine synthetase subunit TsaC/SUA5/YrdC